jgi:hypothetical protein
MKLLVDTPEKVNIKCKDCQEIVFSDNYPTPVVARKFSRGRGRVRSKSCSVKLLLHFFWKFKGIL